MNANKRECLQNLNEMAQEVHGVDATAHTYLVKPVNFLSPFLLAFIGVHSRFNCSFQHQRFAPFQGV